MVVVFAIIVLFPIFLLAALAFTAITSWMIYWQRRPKKKGTVEILPKEESPTYKSTKDESLEITIEVLQKKSSEKGKPLEPKQPPPTP